MGVRNGRDSIPPQLVQCPQRQRIVCNSDDQLARNYDINKGKIEAGYYDRPERIIAAINKTLKKASDEKNVTLSYSKITQKVTVNLDLFSLPMTQTSMEHAQWVEHQPVASIGTGGPIEFLLPGSGDDYLDLANTYLFVRARVLTGDGGRLSVAAPVGPVNNWMHSLFSQVDVSLNGTLVTLSTMLIVHTSKRC